MLLWCFVALLICSCFFVVLLFCLSHLDIRTSFLDLQSISTSLRVVVDSTDISSVPQVCIILTDLPSASSRRDTRAMTVETCTIGTDRQPVPSSLLCFDPTQVKMRDSSWILLCHVSSGKGTFALNTCSTYALELGGTTWRLVEWWCVDHGQDVELRVHSWELEKRR